MSNEDILAVWRAQCAAMDAGDTDALRACFSPDATLTHMTGHVQPLDEWLEAIRRHEFVYHRLVEHDAEVRAANAHRARVVGHITTGITEDGTGQAWPLTCDQDYTQIDGHWLCMNSRVTLGH